MMARMKFTTVFVFSLELLSVAPQDVQFTDSADQGCITISGPKAGQPCIFPFRFGGELKSGCIQDADPEDKFWCSTKVDSNGNHVPNEDNWAHCSEGCRKEKSVLAPPSNRVETAGEGRQFSVDIEGGTCTTRTGELGTCHLASSCVGVDLSFLEENECALADSSRGVCCLDITENNIVNIVDTKEENVPIPEISWRSSSLQSSLDHSPDSPRLSRWRRRVPEPSAESEPEIDQGANLYKPEISNCGEEPNIKEEAAIDTAVVQVKATDRDDPNTGAGKIVYSIVSMHQKFKINPVTGWISTNKIFNRDEPDREKVVYVTVKASDKGRPSLEDVCTITVIIDDINDNAPIFDRAYYYGIPIAQDTKEGTAIMRVSATDIDEGMNQNITYDLIASNFQQDIDYFRWDEKTGIVSLAKKLDKPVGSVFVLEAIARDGGIPPKSTRTDVTIDVKESNNKPPRFRQGPGAEIELSEGNTDYKTPIASYTADSQIPGDPTLFFELLTGRTEQTNKGNTFREEKSYYALTIIASDGEPSSLLNNNKPNQTPYKFKINIKDKNDNPPYFPQQMYQAEVPEDADIGSKVIEVKAKDLDKEASLTTYRIQSGNLGLAFSIEEQTGFIRVNRELDYETIKEYTLIVQAWDGQYSNDTTVHIDILNVNDMKPQFLEEKYAATIKENFVPTYPIFRVSAVDPDIGDPSVPQNISYFLDQTNEFASHFTISDDGAIRIVKPLDRDKPFGYPRYTMFVFAKDENGGPNGRENFVQFEIELEDVNDNAPFLDMPDGLVWPENAPPGEVGKLEATDYDEMKNGPPFTFRIDPKAPLSFKNKFGIRRRQNGDYYLETKTVFDREEQKVYSIPIEIADNQGMKAVSFLKLVIGDKNDNPMEPGSSEIFVYNYRGLAPTTQIGRVYVTDPDDWDLPSKTFFFKDPSKFPDFSLDMDTGMISMKEGIKLDEEIKVYDMEFRVEDPVHQQVGANAVAANVTVTIKKIPQVAVVKSGSIRLNIPPEKFIGLDGREKLAKLLRGYFNANASVVDVFAVLPANGGEHTDVRFAAHGSPYYAPEKMEVTVARRKTDLERQLGIPILMIHIDECLYEKDSCEGSCYNSLEIENQPTAIMTNTTTFVGVTAKVEPRCGCREQKTYASCQPIGYGPVDADSVCLNGGTCEGRQCKCPADNSDVFGPHCEKLSASFRYGWTTHKGISSCSNTTISFRFTTKQSRGLLLYQGPSPNTVVENVTDFFSLEIQDQKLKYFLNFGSLTQIGVLPKTVSDGEEHTVSFTWTNTSVSLILDGGECVPNIRDCQLQHNRPQGKSQFFNSNGPLQVGGLYFGPDRLRNLAAALGLVRDELPAGASFGGCIRELKVREGDYERYISIGTPSDGENYQDGCSMEYVLAVEATGMNLNFLIVLLVVLAIILTTVIILTMYRRRRVHYSDKDIDCDIRENIINYEDEGGGEGDQTGYDLSVLRMMAHENGGPMIAPGMEKMPPPSRQAPGDVPGVGDFLDETKDRVDQDPDATPFDDLRHYAYEGDGNSGGSLSSLNSGTEDGDLEFEYLHNFGPRFKKLADMYGRESDSDDSQEGIDNLGYYPPQPPAQNSVQGGGQPSESWC